MASGNQTKFKKSGATTKEPFFIAATLTDFGKAEVRKLAAQGLTTAEIMARVPPGVPEGSVRALVAVAHRKPKGTQRRV